MRNRFKKIVTLLSLILISFNSVGCWDKWEIEERGLVLALGIDEIPIGEVTDFPGLEGQLLENISERALKVIYQFAIPANLSGDKGGPGPTYFNLTTIAPMSSLVFRGLSATRSSRKADLELLQVLILGSEVAKEGIYPALERLLRDPSVRKQVPVYVTEDNMEDVLDINTNQEATPALYLGALMRNQDWAHRIPPEMRLGTIYRRIREEEVFIVPRITAGKNDSKLAGGGIFYQERLVGWLGEEETAIFRWITNEIEVASIIADFTTKEGVKLIDGYLAERARTIVRPEIVDGELKIVVKVITAGSLLERQLKDRSLDTQALEEIKEKLAKILAMEMKLLIKKAQEEWRLDIFGFDKYVERHYPKIWREIRGRWHEDYFPGIIIETEVDLTITRTGVIR